MRDMEFLPAWYPQTRRARRLVKWQAITTVAVLLGLGGWTLAETREIRDKRALADHLQSQIRHTAEELNLLNEKMTLKARLEQQKAVMDRIGQHVDSSRLIALLVRMMPPDMAVLSYSSSVVEQAATIDSPLKISRLKDSPLERRLEVKLSAVAPSDLDISDFFEKLSGTRFLDEVRLSNNVSDLIKDGHVMRKFEISFCIRLAQGGAS